MKRNTLRKIFIIMLFLGFFWIVPNIVNAAYISVTPSTKNAKPGQAVSVTISSDCIGKVSLSASNGTVSTGSVWVEGSASATVTVGSSGTTTISARAIDMSDSAGNAVSPSGSTTITIASSSSSSGSSNSSNSSNNNGSNSGATSNNNSTSKSNVATLSNLGIRPNDFSGFNANKTSYSTEVPNNVESIEIYANKGQSGQTISGTGKKTLKEGANTFNVVVTAEDGKTKKPYTITVTRKAKDNNSTENATNNETTNEITEEVTETEDSAKPSFGLTKLSISGLELQPQFQTDIYEYKIDLKEDLDKLDIDAVATQENANIEISGNENLQEGENIITILVKGENEDENVAYQIIVNKVLEQEKETPNKEKIIAISGIIALILIIVIIFIVIKVKKSKEGEFVPYENLFDTTKENDGIDMFETSNNSVQIDENLKNKGVDDFEDEEIQVKHKKHPKGKRFK